MGEMTLVEYHSKDCSRLVHGQCSTRRCSIRGGWKPGLPSDYNEATCEALETVNALKQLATVTAEYDALEGVLKHIRKVLFDDDDYTNEGSIIDTLWTGLPCPETLEDYIDAALEKKGGE